MAKTSHNNGELKLTQDPKLFGIGKTKYPNHGLPMWIAGTLLSKQQQK